MLFKLVHFKRKTSHLTGKCLAHSDLFFDRKRRNRLALFGYVIILEKPV